MWILLDSSVLSVGAQLYTYTRLAKDSLYLLEKLWIFGYNTLYIKVIFPYGKLHINVAYQSAA